MISFIGLSLPTVKGGSQVYYSGEAIYYKDKIIIGTVNTGNLEIFEFTDGKINKVADMLSKQSRFVDEIYFDLLFNIENDELFVYLAAGRHLYKYNISDFQNIKLDKQIKDNAWSWYLALDRSDDRLFTATSKRNKLMNYNMDYINEYEVENEYHKNINLNPSGDLIFNVKNDKVEIHSVKARTLLSEAPLVINQKTDKNLFFDDEHEEFYIVDDEKLKVFNYNGNEVRSWKHISTMGYDVVGLDSSNHVYFSDGFGVVKINKESLKPTDWVYTTDLKAKNGWAMGLKVVATKEGEKLIVFNNSSILVVNDDLEIIDYHKIEDQNEDFMEDIFLTTSYNVVDSGSSVTVFGKGYGAHEGIDITFLGKSFTSKADDKGRFEQTIKVPESDSIKTGIDVTGRYTQVTYSVSIEVK